MKNRFDFITNSSSSSFIIALNDRENILKDIIMSADDLRIYGERYGKFITALSDCAPVRKDSALMDFNRNLCGIWQTSMVDEYEKETGLHVDDPFEDEGHNKFLDSMRQQKYFELAEILDDAAIIFEPTFGDCYDSVDLEYFVPTLECCKATISHH